jgi:hypothetical protein
MRTSRCRFVAASLLVCLVAAISLIANAAPVDDDLMALRRLFPTIGPGLRSLRRGADGKYYVLASPNTGLAIFDANGKQLSVIGAPPAAPVANKAGRSALAFGEDCDVDKQGNMYVADGGYNLITVFSPDGTQLRSIPVNGPVSVAALPEGEVAVTTSRQSRLITVYGPDGRVAREFGTPEDVSSREDLNRYLNLGRVMSDPKGRIYYGYTYLPEPLVRQYDRFGFAGLDFEFTGLDAFPEASALRKEIVRQEKREEKRADAAPSFRPVLTAFGVDPVSGDVWMALHNTLLHFDKDGIRQSEYQIYTKDGARIEANVILVEENRLLIGSDPLGVYEFERPDKKQ